MPEERGKTKTIHIGPLNRTWQISNSNYTNIRLPRRLDQHPGVPVLCKSANTAGNGQFQNNDNGVPQSEFTHATDSQGSHCRYQLPGIP